jgi:hypothetical protein
LDRKGKTLTHFQNLSNDQARQQIDAQQLFAAYRDVRAELTRDYVGSMRWRTVSGVQYLVKKVYGRETSLGRQSPETEAIHSAFVDGRNQMRRRRTAMQARLKAMDRVNVAYRLGRVPDLPARIMDALDRALLMGSGVRVVGTTALFAYEAMAGVRFETGIVATQDFDLLLEARAGMELVASDDNRNAVMAALVAADRSFVPRYAEFAVNDAGYEVDFLVEDASDPAPLSGPATEAIAIGQSGRPVRMVVPMPAAFAAHKAWLAKQTSRNPVKRLRDAAQAEAILDALGGFVPKAL